MFTTALFRITKTPEWPECPWTDEWIRRKRDNGILAIKKKIRITKVTTSSNIWAG